MVEISEYHDGDLILQGSVPEVQQPGNGWGKNMTDQKFSGVEFQIFHTDYHTWGFPVFLLEVSLQEGQAGLHKWEPRAII